MSEKKELNQKDLKNVNGGCAPGTLALECPYCHNYQAITLFNYRTTGSGCDEEEEYQCRKCEQWFKL